MFYIYLFFSHSFIRYSFNAESGAVQVEAEPVTLVGHTRKVNCICLSQSFGIAVSASDDNCAIIWDLNEMTYIRTIQSIGLPVNIYFIIFNLF